MEPAKPRVLVVEDSRSCRELVRTVLEEQGYQVSTLSGPFGFLSALVRESPDLVLLDVAMPGVRGDKLVELAAMQDRKRCPMILYSALPEDILVDLVKTSKAAGFIRKTADYATLPDAIRGFLR